MIVRRLIQDAGLIPAISTIFLSGQLMAGDCKIISIRYSDADNFIYAQGDCSFIYEQCEKDFCDVDKLDLNTHGDEQNSIGLESLHDNTYGLIKAK